MTDSLPPEHAVVRSDRRYAPMDPCLCIRCFADLCHQHGDIVSWSVTPRYRPEEPSESRGA